MELQSNPRRSTWLLIACVAGALVVGNTTLQIEYWIVRSGYQLPRDPHPFGGNPKWRWPSENRDRIVSRILRGRAEGDDGPITPDEEREIERSIRHAHNVNKLHTWVETFGCCQYLFAPALLMLSIASYRAQRHPFGRTISIITATIAIVAMAAMWHRQYFTSLGW